MPSSEAPIQPRELNARLVAFFFRNSYLTVLLLVVLVLGGIYSLFTLHTAGFPSPDLNIALVNVSYQGANQVEVERSVVKPLEASLSGIKGVKDLHASARDGFASLNLSFTAGTDFNSALSELRSKVQSTSLPKGADLPEVTIPEIGGNSSFYAITGSGTAASLRAAGELVRQKVEAVAGVKQFKLLSSFKDQVQVRWDPTTLAAHGLSAQQLSQAISGGNLNLPAGILEVGGRVETVVTADLLSGPADLAHVVVGKDSHTGKVLTVADVAQIVPLTQTDDFYQRAGFKDGGTDQGLEVSNAAIYELTFKSDADLLHTDSLVQAAFSDLSSSWGYPDTHIVAVLDTAASTRSQVNEIVSGAVGGRLGHGPFSGLGYLLGGIWLVVVSLLVFVSWRAGLISAVAIPASLLFTLLALRVQGLDLNTLTLFSMVLVLGLVVDPAIVVLEAIQREIDLGHRGRNAVLAAVNTIGSGVFMAALTSILVFVPFGVVSGIFGQIIKYIPLTVIPALLASYFVPLIFLTFLAGRFLRPAKQSQEGEEIANLWNISRWFIRANQYLLANRLRRTLVFWIVGILLPFGIAGYLFANHKIHPVQFSSPPDTVTLNINLEFPSTLTQAEKSSLVAKAEPAITAIPEVNRYFIDSQSGGGVSIMVGLLPLDQRSRQSSAIADDLRSHLNSLNQPDLHQFVQVTELSSGPGNNAFPVAVNIYGDDLATLKAAAIKTGDLLRADSRVTRVEDGFTGVDHPQIAVQLDPARLQTRAMSGAQVAQALGGLLGSPSVTKFSQTIDGSERTVEVILVNTQQPSSAQAVGSEVIGTDSSGPIKVSDVASISESQGFTGINRLNGHRFVTVQAQVKDSLNDATPVQKLVTDYWTKDNLKAIGLSSDALQDKGSGNSFNESFSNLFLALGVSILLTYLVFILYFGSFSQPFIILASLPLALVGVLPALASIGGQFGFLEILGLITLVGIVENVGIFLIDLANRRRRHGADPVSAISEATGIRFRPIFLTKITALGGLLPLMIISPFWRSLALVVVSGILTSGILSLFLTPVLYCWFIWVKQNLYRLLGRPLPILTEDPDQRS